jgi:hypothetical protein
MQTRDTASIFLLVLLFLPGCGGRTPAQPDAPPADTARLAAVRQAIRASDPAAIVGIVTEVLSIRSYVAVSDVPLDEFRAGEPITIIDSQQRVITHGVVRRVTEASLHVEYVKPAPPAREPRVGDLAVRFKQRSLSAAAW